MSSGHCIKKFGLTSSRTLDFARSACVVALTQKVRSDRVGPRHTSTSSVSRPLALPLLILIFLRGGISKKEWAAKARGGFLLGKRKGGIQIQMEPHHAKFFKEWRDAKSVCACPRPTQRAQIPPSKRVYETARTPSSLNSFTDYCTVNELSLSSVANVSATAIHVAMFANG